MKLIILYTLLIFVAGYSALEREIEFEGEHVGNNDEFDSGNDFEEEPEINGRNDFDDTADKYVDRILESVRKDIKEKKLDPLKLPDKEERFKKKIFFKKHLTGGVKFEKGFLKGLSTIKRLEGSNLLYSNDKLVLEATLGFDYLQLYYSTRVWFSFIKLNKHLKASVSSLKVYMKLSQSSDDRNGDTPTLEDFEILNIGKVHTSIKGLGPLNWAVSKISTFAINIFKKTLVKEIEKPIEKLVRKNLHHFNFRL